MKVFNLRAPCCCEILSFDQDLSIKLSKIEGGLTVSNSSLTSLDLSGSSIAGELSLARVKWKKGAKILLRNTSVGTVADDEEAWPDGLRVSLGNFMYQRWGGFGAPIPSVKSAQNPAWWYAKTLDKDAIYSKQPYEQLASVLRAAGYSDDAEDILYAERKRELSEAPASFPQKVVQFLSWIFIGFGHRVYYALFWTIGFVVLGAIIVRGTPEGQAAGLKYGLAYSLDNLIPLVKLRKSHYKIDFAGDWRPERYYFYFHKIMGFVLASFLIAGLSGLTK